MADKADFGLIGLAVMGENLVLNMESRGFHVAVFNRTTSVVEAFEKARGKGKNFVFAKTLQEFVGALKRPRKAQIMVKAGAPVDAVLHDPHGALGVLPWKPRLAASGDVVVTAVLHAEMRRYAEEGGRVLVIPRGVLGTFAATPGRSARLWAKSAWSSSAG
jgi:hypothetical protein